MQTNLDKYKNDLVRLISKGEQLRFAMMYECFPDMFKNKELDDDKKAFIKNLPKFGEEYQAWYSEAKVLIKQLLPDRLDDFSRLYEKTKTRKEINKYNYSIEDYLQGSTSESKSPFAYINEQLNDFGPAAAIPHFEQQIAIVKAVSARFESSLFDIRQLVQSDLFDSELAAAQELLKNGFVRASGAMAGVVLEKHLSQVAKNHNLTLRKKRPTINDFNELLKNSSVLDTPSWRHIQRLGDLRNLCDHNGECEPTKVHAQELIDGVNKFLKTLF